jgi:hypothetical protein
LLPTLPFALLVVPATHGGWMPRPQLALMFWPDAAPAGALERLQEVAQRSGHP